MSRKTVIDTRLPSVTRVNKSFRPQTLADIKLETYIRDWQLTEIEKENLVYFFLREWTAAELADRITFSESGESELIIWKTNFMPIWCGRPEVWEKIKYLAVRGREFIDPLHSPQPKFWLSFRAGNCQREKFAYVLIQEKFDSGQGKLL